jgi:hypothetical protein
VWRRRLRGLWVLLTHHGLPDRLQGRSRCELGQRGSDARTDTSKPAGVVTASWKLRRRAAAKDKLPKWAFGMVFEKLFCYVLNAPITSLRIMRL